MYVRVWEYEVAGEAVEGFTRAYGPQGAWARLFGLAPGYLGTDLYRGTGSEVSFVTVDRWVGEAEWRAFAAEHADRYAALDAELAALTTWERSLGEREVDG